MTRSRLFAVLLLAFALLVPPSHGSASAATRSSTTVAARIYVDGSPTSLTAAMPGERVVFFGSMSPRGARLVVLQVHVARAWHEIARKTASGTWSFAVTAPAPGTRSYRVLLPATATATAAVSANLALTVVRPAIVGSSPTRVEAGRLLTITGRAIPARVGHVVRLWEQRGRRWVPVADARQDAGGAFTLRIRAAALGRHVYREVTLGADNRFGVRSAPHTVTTVKPSTAGLRSTFLADVTPLSQLVGPAQGRPVYTASTLTLAGRPYAKSIRTASYHFSYELGAEASSFATALALAPAATGAPNRSRLVQVRVDHSVRVRRFVTSGQVLPIVLDVRFAKVVTIQSWDRGPLDLELGPDLVLGRPVVMSAALAERNAIKGTVMSDLPPTSVSAGMATRQVVGSYENRLYGGSITLAASNAVTASGNVDYVLLGAFTRLSGFVGLTGETDRSLTGTLKVFGDGQLLATVPARAGTARAISLDISGVQKLRLQFVSDLPAQSWGHTWYVTLADPRVT